MQREKIVFRMWVGEKLKYQHYSETKITTFVHLFIEKKKSIFLLT